MNITMFCDQFYPELGGIPDCVDAISRALRVRGHGVTLHVPQYRPATHLDLGHNRRPVTPHDHVPLCRRRAITYPSNIAPARLSAPSATQWLRLMRRHCPDIIHVHSFLGLGLEGLAVARLLKVPVIATNHTAVKAFQAYFPVPASMVSKFVLWFCNRCDTVTAPSHAAFDDADMAKLRKPFYIMPNPVELEVFHAVTFERKRQLKAKLGLPSRTICYAGRLAPEKAIGCLLKAMKVLQDVGSNVLLIIAGAGSEYRTLIAMARELGISSNVRFVGVLDHESLATLFHACDAFVTMSVAEVMSMSLIQAMACGLPVICPRSVAFSNIVRDELNGYFVEPENVQELASKILTLLADSDATRPVCQMAADSVKAFALEKIAQDWEEVYLRTIQSKRRLQWR